MAGKIELKAPLDGVVTLEPEDTASNFTVTIPAGNAELFSQANIVGTVSESSGVPTGAIIERDGNANGIYTKWADGTMICSFTQSGGGDTRWDFPATFAFNPEISATIAFDSTNSGRAAFILSNGTGSCRHVGWAIGSDGNLNMAATAARLLIAHGRWF